MNVVPVCEGGSARSVTLLDGAGGPAEVLAIATTRAQRNIQHRADAGRRMTIHPSLNRCGSTAPSESSQVTGCASSIRQ